MTIISDWLLMGLSDVFTGCLLITVIVSILIYKPNQEIEKEFDEMLHRLKVEE